MALLLKITIPNLGACYLSDVKQNAVVALIIYGLSCFHIIGTIDVEADSDTVGRFICFVQLRFAEEYKVG